MSYCHPKIWGIPKGPSPHEVWNISHTPGKGWYNLFDHSTIKCTILNRVIMIWSRAREK